MTGTRVVHAVCHAAEIDDLEPGDVALFMSHLYAVRPPDNIEWLGMAPHWMIRGYEAAQ